MYMRTQIVVSLFIILFLQQSTLWSNMSNPLRKGETLSEPQIGLANISIVRETLHLDLRPLGKSQSARIQAVYYIDNAGSKINTELLFVSPGIQSGKVTLDDVILPVKKELSQGLDQSLALKFNAEIKPGQHTISVDYMAKPGEDHRSEPYRDYLIDYNLAPAKRWKSFGQLDVRINIPEGWVIKESTPIDQYQLKNNVLKALFKGIPADMIHLKLGQDSLSSGFSYGLFYALACILILLMVYLLYRLGLLRLSPDKCLPFKERVWKGIVTLSAGALFLLGFLFAMIWLMKKALGLHISHYFSYTLTLYAMLFWVGVIVLFFGLYIVILIAPQIIRSLKNRPQEIK